MKKIKITINIDQQALENIDRAAELVERSRSNYMQIAALQKIRGGDDTNGE